ncbi:MAG: 16S rRNA methyltransferase [Chlamydiae bacterium CG10_big_fil_rev_8_21_14_0_10_42_34]|nr:MAG: 16S rRNA methyltransferase [Chlamydiae bacterium CG10_big_fil_rev_8_21_14_0_10_42_34]
MPGKLYILPNLLDEELDPAPFLPISVNAAVAKLDGLIAESEKMGRRYLRKFISHDEMAKCPLRVLNEHTSDINELIIPMEKGECWGLISDAGLACIADPGADLVWLAHQKKISVETFVGPSSLIMALQLSGLSGQQFSFHGYLPRDAADLEKKIKELERQPGAKIWIEAPYRSAKMLDQLLKTLQPSTKLCVAVNLTMATQRVVSQTVAHWKGKSFPLGKEPAVFLIQ